jgi:large subunit ribosomal protein L25
MLTLKTEPRTELGKGASRRLRRGNWVPAVVYGGEQPPLSIQFNQDVINNTESKAGFYNTPLSLMLDGQAILVKVQAVQRHPFKPKLQHLDFLRLSQPVGN